MTSRHFSLLLSVAVIAFSPLRAPAESFEPTPPPPPQAEVIPAAVKKKEVKLTPGVIASYGSSPRQTAVSVTGSGESPGDEQSPVTGSIKQVTPGKCDVVVQNSSGQDTFSVSYAVVGIDEKGRETYRRTFTDSLAPKKSETHRVDCEPGLSMQVQLRSGKRKSS